MSIFISYSQKDKKFVDQLAMNLVRARHHVWVDRWELNVGDSLIDRIQSALTDSSAILVILSKASVKSNWCQKELSAGLVRELTEKQVVVMPCLIEDCEIPLFLRDKKYADFRNDPDQAISEVRQALAKISNASQGRTVDLRYHTDWSVDSFIQDETLFIEWKFVSHGHEWPYVILTECLMVGDASARGAFLRAVEAEKRDNYVASVMTAVIRQAKGADLQVEISDERPRIVQGRIVLGPRTRAEVFSILVKCRRLGEDNGMDTIFYLDKTFQNALQHMNGVVGRPEMRAAKTPNAKNAKAKEKPRAVGKKKTTKKRGKALRPDSHPGKKRRT